LNFTVVGEFACWTLSESPADQIYWQPLKPCEDGRLRDRVEVFDTASYCDDAPSTRVRVARLAMNRNGIMLVTLRFVDLLPQEPPEPNYHWEMPLDGLPVRSRVLVISPTEQQDKRVLWSREFTEAEESAVCSPILIGRDRIYCAATYDLVAIDFRTGKLIYDCVVFDRANEDSDFPSAPLRAHNTRLLQASSGSEYIVQLVRHQVPYPGRPGRHGACKFERISIINGSKGQLLQTFTFVEVSVDSINMDSVHEDVAVVTTMGPRYWPEWMREYSLIVIWKFSVESGASKGKKNTQLPVSYDVVLVSLDYQLRQIIPSGLPTTVRVHPFLHAAISYYKPRLEPLNLSATICGHSLIPVTDDDDYSGDGELRDRLIRAVEHRLDPSPAHQSPTLDRLFVLGKPKVLTLPPEDGSVRRLRFPSSKIIEGCDLRFVSESRVVVKGWHVLDFS
jgi:hypothetical protein